jgi:hypothetical protein
VVAARKLQMSCELVVASDATPSILDAAEEVFDFVMLPIAALGTKDVSW